MELAAGAQPVEAVPGSRLLKWMTGPIGHRLDRWTVEHLGYSFISWQASRDRGIAYQSSLLLVTLGRKTGIERPVVLPYVYDGDRLVVVASNAGSAAAPAWVCNLVAEPRCTIIVDRRKRAARARVAEGAERERLMDVVAAERPHIYNYEYHVRRNGRRLDLVVLELTDSR